MRLVGLVLLVVSVACASRAKQSVALYEAGDYAGAARAADTGLAAHPDDDALWGMRIRAALALGDADGVATAYASYVAHRRGDDHELLGDLAVATLGQALASPSARLKIAAIETVAASKLQDLHDQVGERLGDDDDRVAAAAAAAVLKDYPQAPQVADAMLHSEHAVARRIAVDGIGRRPDVAKLAVAELERAADDPDARVRGAALGWLGSIKDPGAVEVGTRRLRDPDEAVRAAAATALAQIGLGDLAALAKQALGDPARAVRLAGIRLLAAAHRDAELVALVTDADGRVGLAAALAAPRALVADVVVTEAVTRAMKSDDETTRAAAATELVAAVGRDAARTLVKGLVADPAVGVRLAAARVLAQTGDRAAAIQVFTAALASPDDIQAATELAELGDRAGLTALSAFVRDARRTPEQRAAAATAHRTAHHVTPGLVAALADSSGLVRVEAAAALAALAK